VNKGKNINQYKELKKINDIPMASKAITDSVIKVWKIYIYSADQ
jgi:hypothetical protein